MTHSYDVYIIFILIFAGLIYLFDKVTALQSRVNDLERKNHELTEYDIECKLSDITREHHKSKKRKK